MEENHTIDMIEDLVISNMHPLLGRADDYGTVCSDTGGTDCSASMVPNTVLHLVDIDRFLQSQLDKAKASFALFSLLHRF